MWSTLRTIFAKFLPDDAQEEPAQETSPQEIHQVLPDNVQVVPAQEKSLREIRREEANGYMAQLQNFYSQNSVAKLMLPLCQDPFLDTHYQSAWFDDSLIFNYFCEITKDNPKIYTLDSMFTSFKNPDFFERLRTRPSFRNKIKNKFIDADLIFWPMSINNHWILLILDKSHQSNISWYWLDGMNAKKQPALSTYVLNLLEILQPERLQAAEEGDILALSQAINISRQNNAYDCGPAVCQAGHYILEHFMTHGTIPHDLTNQMTDYTTYRLHIAKTLIVSKEREAGLSTRQGELRQGEQGDRQRHSVLGKRTRDHIR